VRSQLLEHIRNINKGKQLSLLNNLKWATILQILLIAVQVITYGAVTDPKKQAWIDVIESNCDYNPESYFLKGSLK
jgi:hypothetical protein